MDASHPTAAFETAPKKSVDYALMEKTELASVVPASFGWSDVGNWASVWEASPHDEKGNVANIAIYDVRDKNGVLHVVDRMLEPNGPARAVASN